MKDDPHNPTRGIITGLAIGLVLWSAIGLYFIYDFQPVHVDRGGWTCGTDSECEAEAVRRGLTTD